MIEITALASGSAGNCYRISDQQAPLLLEAGIPIKAIKQGLGYRLSEIQAVLVSHSHMDHAKAAEATKTATPIDLSARFRSLRANRLT